MNLRKLAVAAGVAAVLGGGLINNSFAAGPPAVTGVAPNGGPYTGGTQITIAGTNFTGATDVLYTPPGTGSTGDVSTLCPSPSYSGPTPCFIVNSDSQITAITPPHPKGTVDVQVKTGAGTSAPIGGDHFGYTEPTPVGAVLAPHAGPAAGGTQVTITAATSPGHFLFATAVTIGSGPSATTITTTPCPGASPSNCFTVNSDNQITAYVPPAPTPAADDTSMDVTVSNAAGTGPANAPDDQWTWASPPTVTTVSPNSGSDGGATTTVTGTHFQSNPAGAYSATAVTLTNTVDSTDHYSVAPCPAGVTLQCFTVNSQTSITLHTPATTYDATYDVQVVTPGGTSATSPLDQFTTTAAPPVVQSLSPSTGPAGGGITVQITGSGGSLASTSSVDFGGPGGVVTAHPCPPTVTAPCFTVVDNQHVTVQDIPSASQAAAPNPPTAVESVPVSVTTNGGTSTANPSFTYYAQATVTSVTPSSLPQGSTTTVNIAGTNFVNVSEIDLTPTTGTPISITATCGASTTDCFSVQSSSAVSFVLPSGAPTAGYVVTVTTPAGPSTTTPGGSSAFSVTFPSGVPAVSAVSPDAGPVGGLQQVTVTGSGFSGAGWTVSTVHVGATAVTASPCPATPASACFSVVTATQLTLYTPSGSGNSVVDITVTVTSTDGTESATSSAVGADQYEYAAAPTVSLVSPSFGTTAGMTQVSLTGSNFSDTLYTSQSVSFGSVAVSVSPCPPTPSSPCFTVNSATSITVYSPPQSASVVDVTVTTPGGTSATSGNDHYQYIASVPAVTGVAPSGGPTGGGTAVTISGSGFTGATDVHFGSTDVTSACPASGGSGCLTVVNDTTINATTPGHVAGTVHVTVTTAGGTSPTGATDQFTYSAPVVSGVAPSVGPTGGGTAVTISGTGFTAATDVHFGSADVTSACPASGATGCFTVVNDTTINATTPVHAAGTVHVTVTSGGSTSATGASDQFTYLTGPTVTSLSKPAGPEGGVTRLTIAGTNFSGAGYTTLSVHFGGSSVTTSPCPATPSSPCFTVTSATSLLVYTPAGPPGPATVTVTTQGGTSPSSGAPTYLYVAAGVYQPLQPYRVLDTRQGSCVNCGNLGPVGPGSTRPVSLTPTGQVPSTALSVVLNVTAVNATSSTFVTVYPNNVSRPTASNLNPSSAAPISNLVVSAMDPSQILNVYNLSGSVDIIVDVQGYFAAPAGINPAGQFHAVSPTRVCDTRAGTGTPCSSSPLGSHQWRLVTLTNLSSAASAAAFNLTGTGDTADTFLSVTQPNGSDQCPGAAPTFSNLNLSAGATQPIRVVVPVGPNHDVCVYNLSASINVILDVNGWFGKLGDSSGARFYAVGPVRICDTRSAGYACPAGAPGPGGVVTTPASQLGTPVAIAANATAVLPSASTFVTLYPSDVGLPNASDLNVVPSQVLPNFAFVKVASGGAQPGSVNAYNLAGSVNVLLDLVGWFE